MRVIILRKQLSPEEAERIRERREERRQFMARQLKWYVDLITELQPAVKSAQEKLATVKTLVDEVAATFTYENLAIDPVELGKNAEKIMEELGELLDELEPDSLVSLLNDIFGIVDHFKIGKPILRDIVEELSDEEIRRIVEAGATSQAGEQTA